MVNYQNGKIYAIKSNSGDKIYVGSTTKKYLSERMSDHRGSFKVWKKGNATRCMSYELFTQYGVENCYIELIELFPCNTKDELTTRENHYIRSLVCVNKQLAISTPESRAAAKKKYEDNNQEKIKESHRASYERNKELIRERGFLYREENEEHIRRVKAVHYDKHREAIQRVDRMRYAWKVISREFRAILNED
tara:strand:- start:271 stop:849 length:579 start_codon:yes stop_codon:yes gene_type:complete